MAYVKCECGCEVFFQAPIIKVDEGDAVVYNGASMKATVNTISLLICLQCSRAVLPSVTFPHRNRQDAEVMAYGEVHIAVNNRNGGIKGVEASGLDRLASNRIVG